jgi:hypothetical protein
MIKSKKYQLLLLLFIVVVLGFIVFRFFEIDTCLDGGGKWNYDKCECDNSIE